MNLANGGTLRLDNPMQGNVRLGLLDNRPSNQVPTGSLGYFSKCDWDGGASYRSAAAKAAAATAHGFY